MKKPKIKLTRNKSAAALMKDLERVKAYKKAKAAKQAETKQRETLRKKIQDELRGL